MSVELVASTHTTDTNLTIKLDPVDAVVGGGHLKVSRNTVALGACVEIELVKDLSLTVSVGNSESIIRTTVIGTVLGRKTTIKSLIKSFVPLRRVITWVNRRNIIVIHSLSFAIVSGQRGLEGVLRNVAASVDLDGKDVLTSTEVTLHITSILNSGRFIEGGTSFSGGSGVGVEVVSVDLHVVDVGGSTVLELQAEDEVGVAGNRGNTELVSVVGGDSGETSEAARSSSAPGAVIEVGILPTLRSGLAGEVLPLNRVAKAETRVDNDGLGTLTLSNGVGGSGLIVELDLALLISPSIISQIVEDEVEGHLWKAVGSGNGG